MTSGASTASSTTARCRQELRTLFHHQLQWLSGRAARSAPTSTFRYPNRSTAARIQEPRQPDLAHHGRRDGVLHLVPGLPARWLQSRNFGPSARCQRNQPVHHAGRLATGQADQQRIRLEDRMVQASPAVQWLHLPGESGTTCRPDSTIRRAASDSLAFFSNGPSYRVRGVEPSVIWRVTDGLTVQAAAILEQQQPDQFALSGQRQSQEPGLRSGDHLYSESLRAAGQSARQFAAISGQRARPVRVEIQ